VATIVDVSVLRPLRLVIIDDQPVFRRVARVLLVARGHQVVGEADCACALDAVARLAPDGVLLDVCLGPECGFEVARALTQAHPGLAVVLVSADWPQAGEERLHYCGARGFVLKSKLVATDLSDFCRR
jgi:DNA-binding NarL/FixJ family response regulator